MNTRQAKKMLCHPVDPHMKPSSVAPYNDAQILESGRVYHRGLKRGDREGRVKWSSVRPTVYRGRWRPGYTGAAHYGLKAQRVAK
jgi:protocatechuate 3,4-dioxygenase beta subunit